MRNKKRDLTSVFAVRTLETALVHYVKRIRVLNEWKIAIIL